MFKQQQVVRASHLPFSSCTTCCTIVHLTCSTDGFVDDVSHSLCKLLAALGDHSAMYFAKNIAAPAHVAAPAHPLPFALPAPLPTVAHLVQHFLRLLLAYTALPGYYGAEEEESEMTLSFWYLFQEALWNTDFGFDVAEDGDAGNEAEERERDMMPVARAVYTELVAVLRRKVVWPPRPVLDTWARGEYSRFPGGCRHEIEYIGGLDQRDKFQA